MLAWPFSLLSCLGILLGTKPKGQRPSGRVLLYWICGRGDGSAAVQLQCKHGTFPMQARTVRFQCKHGTFPMQARYVSNASTIRFQCKHGTFPLQARYVSNASTIRFQCKHDTFPMQARYVSNNRCIHLCLNLPPNTATLMNRQVIFPYQHLALFPMDGMAGWWALNL